MVNFDLYFLKILDFSFSYCSKLEELFGIAGVVDWTRQYREVLY